jgi:hypothetical protein
MTQSVNGPVGPLTVTDPHVVGAAPASPMSLSPARIFTPRSFQSGGGKAAEDATTSQELVDLVLRAGRANVDS